MEHLNKLEKMNERERGHFRDAVNALTTRSFLIRGVDRDKELFRFVMSNLELFEAYFDIAGWELRRDESLGVIAWQGTVSSRFNLNLDETLSLLVIRLLYEEKRNEIGLQEYPTIHQNEFREKFEIVTERALKKTRLRDILRRFQSLRLIAVRGEETDPQTLILLYPSIVFALDSNGIDEIHSRIEAFKSQIDGGKDIEFKGEVS